MKARFLLAVALFVLVAATTVDAQPSPSGVIGRVTTEGGSVCPRARVRAVHRETKKIVSVVTDDAGEYAIDLVPGVYDIDVVAQSWNPARRSGLTILPNAELIVDFVLQPQKEGVVD